jgi:ABC-type antimicrobial peptide transport system permease subunit
MTILVILGIVIGAALVVTALAYTRRSRKSKEPIQLDVGRRHRL